MTTKRFTVRLKLLRAERKLSQADLAKASGVSREYIARLELGQQDPTLGTLTKLAKALKVTVGELVDGEPTKAKRPARKRARGK